MSLVPSWCVVGGKEHAHEFFFAWRHGVVLTRATSTNNTAEKHNRTGQYQPQKGNFETPLEVALFGTDTTWATQGTKGLLRPWAGFK